MDTTNAATAPGLRPWRREPRVMTQEEFDALVARSDARLRAQHPDVWTDLEFMRVIEGRTNRPLTDFLDTGTPPPPANPAN